MPATDSTAASTIENDTLAISTSVPGTGDALYDANRLYGQVLYVNGLETDQPLAITRNHYADASSTAGSATYAVYAPFSIIPLWNNQGGADRAVVGGTAAPGEDYLCTDSGKTRCANVYLDQGVFPYARSGAATGSWNGTVLVDKADATGTYYRRARTYDPSSARFTQEDPIGLAGGVNEYGFASGDPVTYSDPFGLCPKSGGGDGKTDSYADCPEGSSGYYANRDATGHGGLVNNLEGAVASCSESTLCTGTAIIGGIVTGGILVRAAIASPLIAGAGSAGVPIVASAQDKLTALEGQFGVASSNIVQMAMNGARYVDNANGGNINALLARPDGAAGFIRVTFDPNFQRVISAGLMRANQVTNAIANGRFTPYCAGRPMTDYRRRLDGLIQDVLDERLSMEQFQREYSQCFIEEMPDNALSPTELEQYGAVHEKAEWTTREPPKEDRAFGWMDASDFRDWLKTHRPTPYS